MSLLNAVDMSRITGLFDGRSTVPERDGSFSVRELFTNSKYASSGFEQILMEKAKGVIGLYTSIGRPEFDSALKELSLMSHDSFEWPFRVAAVVLAYCIQLESINRSSNRG